MPLIKSSMQTRAAEYERETERDCDTLIEHLCDTSDEVRRWAARDLQYCPGSSSILVDHLQIEPEPSVREVIFTTLTRLGDVTAVDGLVACLRSDDAALRNEAVLAMQQLPGAVAPIMQDLLHDADSDVRIFAVNILESLRHPNVEQWLREVIESDPQINVCATAVDLLGEVGSPDSMNSLQKLKTRFTNEPYIQFAADLAIQRIMDH